MDTNSNSNSNDKIGSGASKDDETPPDASVMKSKQEEEEEAADDKSECWGIVKVFDPAKESGVLCRMDGCPNAAVAVWQSTLDPQGEDVWPLCEPCQEEHFGIEDYSKDSPKGGDGGASEGGGAWVLVNRDTQPGTADLPSTKPSSSETAPAPKDAPVKKADQENKDEDVSMNEADADGEQHWELAKIFTKDELTEEKLQCEEDGCTLLAAVIWVNTNNPSEKWRACLDCQELHFGGWPDQPEEFPVQHMTQEHKDHLVEKCSRHPTVTMPAADDPWKPTDATNPATQPTKGGRCAPEILMKQKDLCTRWKAAAVEMGGPDAQIVLDKAVAKEMVRQFLCQQTRPVSLSQIYKGLKAVVPSPIVTIVLNEMVLDKDGPSLKFSL